MDEKKRVVIVDDHQLFREGLRSMILSRKDTVVVGEAADGLEAIRCIHEKKPELLLLDISMPRLDGISVIREIRGHYPDLKILVLTVHQSNHYVIHAFRAGADGYCNKNSSLAELMTAIDSVLEGNPYLNPFIENEVLRGCLVGGKTVKKKSDWEVLTQREREVLKLVAEGYMNKEIGELLGISVKTVEKHRTNIMRKLDRHNVPALTSYAIEKGLVAPKL